MTGPVSHGRGGAANIRPDDTVYTDGEIVREGVVGDQGDGKYSAGRGGRANILGETVDAKHMPHDAEIVPETATRIEKEESHHYGRGGAGNATHTHTHTHAHKEHEHGHESLIDKAKHVFHHSDKK